MTGGSIIDVDCCQRAKQGQFVAGDVFLSRKIKEEGRVIAVLSDGLGSGVKASVLANLTATMAMKYTAAFVDINRSARTIMDTLPICQVRRISYSTFTIIDIDGEGRTRISEHGNPALVLLRDQQEVSVPKTTFSLEQWQDRLISHAGFCMQEGDRMLAFSDGISQAGMGSPTMPLGWGRQAVVERALQLTRRNPQISSRQLARALVDEAIAHDGSAAKDDITCVVITFRRPRYLTIVTGPPFSRERDRDLVDCIRTAPGRKAICGGTTANIVARLLDRPVTMDLDHLDPQIPPMSRMQGVDLVTEGFLTLARAAELLEKGQGWEAPGGNAAQQLVALMLDSDVVEFVVGTRINEAHQDPNVPVELDLRRNVVRKILALLETRYLRQGTVRFV
jgi:hypothetical protein